MRTALLLLLCVVLAGCGEDVKRVAAPSATPAGSPDERAIRQTLDRYAAAIRAGDATMICAELLAPEVLETVERAGGDCARDLMADRVAEGGPDYALEVGAITVDGDRATAQTEAIERDGPRAAAQPLVRVGGGWRLSS
jgi:hypothetical protein